MALPTQPAASTRRSVGCDLVFQILEPSTLALQIAPPTVLDEELVVVGGSAPREVRSPFGERTHLISAAPGEVTVRYRAEAAPELRMEAVDEFDDEVLVARRQSRYCPSDTMAEYAVRELGRGPNADAVGAWVFERITYDSFVSTSADSAVDTLLAGRGVCRDFAHLMIAMCRALLIPARLAAVYAPGVAPMDFHAVVEVWRDGHWDVIDPTRMAPRSSLVRIATGRDAADTAFAATIDGDIQLISAEVMAIVDGNLPADDHGAAVRLA